MATVAGALSRLAQARPEYDLRPHFPKAFSRYIEWIKDNTARRKAMNKSVNTYVNTDIETALAQVDMFAQRDEIEEDLVRILAAARESSTARQWVR